MYSRSQLCAQTGLTRKALRIYEERGLLSPTIISDRSVRFSQSDAERAILIKHLRDAGISINLIDTFLSGDSEHMKDIGKLIHKEVRERIEISNIALSSMEEFIQQSAAQPERFRFGGFWIFGRKKRLNKSEVTDYVSAFTRFVKTSKITPKIIAIYSNETARSVDLGCYVQISTQCDYSQYDLRRDFLSQKTWCSLQTQGVVGNYHCFDKDYDILSGFQTNTSNLEEQIETSIEIYKDYPPNSSGSAFEAQILV